MATELWPFQQKACDAALEHWRAGTRRVLLVAPTGAGKSRMGAELAGRALDYGVLWITHRTELIRQSAAHLERELGIAPAIVAPGWPIRGGSKLTVASVQTLLARGYRPQARLVIIDEFHHFMSDEWSKIAGSYGMAAMLGLTATPERSDGRPLGHIADVMVVAATYPELVEGGYLCPARLFRPGEMLTRALAKNPLESYRAHGEGKKAFVFCPTVPLAKQWAEEWTAAGIPSACITQSTPADERARIMGSFRSGELQALHNVYVLTEGVDVPDAGCIVLARNVGHQTPYLQMVGRGLRRSPGKEYGIVIDLPGCSFAHGLPTADRDYSLDDGIMRKKESEAALRVCLQCGFTSTAPKCPRCGFQPDPKRIARPTIYDMALQEVPNDWSPDKIQQAFAIRGSPGYVKRKYEKLFGNAPNMRDVPVEIKRREWHRLVALCNTRGYKIGWASHRWKAIFGFFPPREWLSESLAK